MTKTSGIHEVTFLESCLAVRHLVSREDITVEVQENRVVFHDLRPTYNVKPISSGGLTLPATHFVSIHHIAALRI